MSNNGGRDLSGGSSQDCRLRYSRRAILFGLLGGGVLMGFRNPVELLGQPSGGASGSGSSADESTTKESGQRDDRGGAKEDQSESKPEDDAREADQREPKEEPPPPGDPTMRMYIPRLALQGDTVMDGDSEEALARGAMKLPNTGYPWQDGANPYITGHRIGYPGRESYYQFYNLPAMRRGDAVYLRDANGALYEYRVSEKFAVSPSESWVTEPVKGKDLVTLQTCVDSVARSTWWEITPKLMEAGPDTGRLIVRAERV